MIPHNEKIVETKKCRISDKEFVVTDRDLEFYDKISPIFGGKKYLIPSPTLSPEERQRRRLSWRNERTLHKRKCDKTGKDLISIYSETSICPVYYARIWWSDEIQTGAFHRDFDFTKTFSQNFSELQRIVPMPHRTAEELTMVNSDYVNEAGWIKNCYLCAEMARCENCYFCRGLSDSKNTLDCLNSSFCEQCYELVDCNNCHTSVHSQNCTNCRDISYCRDCISCQYCFGSTNLRNKKYVYCNEQLDEKTYREKIVNHTEPKIQTSILRANHNIQTENSIGEYLIHTKDVSFCFDCTDAEHCKYCTGLLGGTKNSHSMDVDYFGIGAQFCYDCQSVGGNPGASNNLLFCNLVWPGNNVLYSHFCVLNTSNCFGCIGLKKGAYSILNKAYGVQEYEGLCGKLVDHMRSTGEWGEFFPHELSPFGYNETVAQEYFPMTEKEVQEKDWNWYDEPEKIFTGSFLQPQPISQYDEKRVGYETAQKNIDTLLQGTIQCQITQKPFKIIKQELIFCIENQISIPTKHPDQRHKERMSLRNPRKFYDKSCSECGKNIVTTYNPEKKEKVVCEECYRKIIY